ncbi:MAG TPA: hypothetical protein DCM28_09335 [Phycisphaerales bacterium]|nr:hypothetical protein [Phycisphaerales bacterium]HCD34287.1 hypothetical protein [Phycisphaerales bacterium]|tara:strand:+ start:1240 stop:1560 length:321 start_codon:yes stop_codon:yes gene_type:complete
MGGELKNRTRLSITLKNDLAERVRQLASDDRTSISNVIESIIARHIEHAELKSRFTHDPLAGGLIEQLLTPENLERAAKIVGDKTLKNDLLSKREEALKKSSGRKK